MIFLPSVGHLDVYQLPVGKGIRVDNGLNKVWIFLFTINVAKLIALVKLVKKQFKL
jgi:acetyl/propionyl-CoA carboxylase alpha subunit